MATAGRCDEHVRGGGGGGGGGGGEHVATDAIELSNRLRSLSGVRAYHHRRPALIVPPKLARL